MRWHKIDHVLFHRQRADIVSQLSAMRADVMHGQHIKHCGYTPDIRIRLNNPELSEAVVPDSLQIFLGSAWKTESMVTPVFATPILTTSWLA